MEVHLEMNSKNGSFMKYFFLLVSSLTLPACSLDASLEQLDSIAKVFTNKTGEVVNTSSQKFTTPGGKTVSVSLGSNYNNLVGETKRGYKVYSTVQGQIISVQGDVQ